MNLVKGPTLLKIIFEKMGPPKDSHDSHKTSLIIMKTAWKRKQTMMTYLTP